MACDALDSLNFDERIIVGRLAVVPKIIVTPGDEDLADQHFGERSS
jgi:hypothetical protein